MQVSEGIDFSNDKGRAVVITGLPFPPTKDPKIVLKKSILDEVVVPPGELVSSAVVVISMCCTVYRIHTDSRVFRQKLTGNQWYIQQASRAVNQAVGRVIRHRHDYGAIILLDERFGLQQQQKCLSKWLQPYCFTCRSYGASHRKMRLVVLIAILCSLYVLAVVQARRTSDSLGSSKATRRTPRRHRR